MLGLGVLGSEGVGVLGSRELGFGVGGVRDGGGELGSGG